MVAYGLYTHTTRDYGYIILSIVSDTTVPIDFEYFVIIMESQFTSSFPTVSRVHNDFKEMSYLKYFVKILKSGSSLLSMSWLLKKVYFHSSSYVI